jgi:hypothetical protein
MISNTAPPTISHNFRLSADAMPSSLNQPLLACQNAAF